MDNWVSIAYQLGGGPTWEAYRRMSRTDRALMARSLNRLLKNRQSLTGDPKIDRKI